LYRGANVSVSFPVRGDLRSQRQPPRPLAGSYFENMTDTSDPLPERVAAMRISPRFFSVLATLAALNIASQAAAITGAGVVLGIAGARTLSRVMAALVFDVTVHDPLTFTLAPIVLAVVAAAATIVPARRAANVDPMHALRED
jgi:hypothetical protein